MEQLNVEEIALTIDGKNISCTPGTSIFDAALENGIKIPSLCNHHQLDPVGACRLCLVEDVKTGRTMASCVTPVSPHMDIRTDSLTLKKYRTNIIRLMIANHPESCIVCNQGNRCELRRIAAQLGIGETGLYPMPHYTGLEEANPFIIRDLSKCILCGKCIRADHELVVIGAIDYNLRGFKSRPATAHALPLEKSNCTFCGTCISMCPTGALLAKSNQWAGSPQNESSTICGFCGVGCNLVMGSVDDHIVEVNPSHEKGTVNCSTLCIRGHFAHDFLGSPKRLDTPMIRRDGELEAVSWSDALKFVVDRLISIQQKHGPQRIGFFGSSKCTNEENYLFQKIARVLIGTNNVDNGGYVFGEGVMRRLYDRLSWSGRATSLSGLERAEAIFVMGANPTHSMPVVGYYVKRAAHIRKTPLIVADPRRTELAPFSSAWVQLHPDSDCHLMNALAAILFRRKSYAADFVKQFTTDFDVYSAGLSSFDMKEAYKVTGIARETLENIANMVEGKKIAFIVGTGILQQRSGSLTMDALINLALMTGNLGGSERGIYLLYQENNQRGAQDMGMLPDCLPGYRPLKDDANRKQWETFWETPLPPDPGLDLVRMIHEADKGNLKALYVMGENPLRSLPEPGHVRKALERLEFLIVQDILSTETTEMADVVLPASAFSEKEGSFTNMEGRIQNFRPIVSPPGEARPDWEILALMAEKMGYTKKYDSIKKIRKEISEYIPQYVELDGSRDVCWVKESGDSDSFSFTPIQLPRHKVAPKTYPFTAILGSYRCHLGSATRTNLSMRVRDFGFKGEVEICPEDGVKLNLTDEDTVRVISAHGSMAKKIRLVRGLSPGLIFIPTGFNGNDTTNLMELSPLDASGESNGWKTCQVKIEKIDE